MRALKATISLLLGIETRHAILSKTSPGSDSLRSGKSNDNPRGQPPSPFLCAPVKDQFFSL
jgi:hypothetical protein